MTERKRNLDLRTDRNETNRERDRINKHLYSETERQRDSERDKSNKK